MPNTISDGRGVNRFFAGFNSPSFGGGEKVSPKFSKTRRNVGGVFSGSNSLKIFPKILKSLEEAGILFLC